MKILCLLGIHYDISERAYYIGEGDFPTETAGVVKVCLRCGRIVTHGIVIVPEHYYHFQREAQEKKK